jgi:hypothetical protein
MSSEKNKLGRGLRNRTNTVATKSIAEKPKDEYHAHFLPLHTPKARTKSIATIAIVIANDRELEIETPRGDGYIPSSCPPITKAAKRMSAPNAASSTTRMLTAPGR